MAFTAKVIPLPWDRFKPRSPRAKVAVALAGFLAALCLCLVGFAQAKRLAGETARQVARYIEGRTGFTIDFKDHDIGFGNVSVEGVRIVHGSTSTIGTVSAELNLNPLRADWGKPERVRIRLVKAKVSLKRFREDVVERIAGNGAGKEKAVNAATAAAVASMKDLLNHPMLPPFLMVEKGTFILTDEANEPIFTFANVDFAYDRARGRLRFSVDELSYRARRLLEKVSGEVRIAEPGDAYPFTLAYKDAAGKQQWNTRGTLLKDLSGLSFFVKNRGLPKDLEPWLGKYLVDARQFHYAAKVNVFARKDGEGFTFGTQIASGNLKVRHALIGPEPVGPTPFRLRAYGEFHPETGTLDIRQGNVTLKKLAAGPHAAPPVLVNFRVRKPDLFDLRGKLPWHVSMELPPTPCQSVLDNAPPGLMPKLARFRFLGEVGVKLDVDVHPSLPERFEYRLQDGQFGCQAIATPYLMSRDRLLAANPLDVDMRRVAEEPELYVPLPRDYTPLEQVPEYFYKALIVAEDAGFWFHKGFAWGAMEAAVRRNLAEREVQAGGSTISMQTAKNLFLDQDRTLTRKLQEMFLTWHLERSLPKRKILEIYMNIIDYGPGIKGIRNASRHFFDKEPRELGVAEAAYLATVLPSPAKRYRNFCEGRVSAQYRPVVQKNLERLLAFDFITMSQYAAASRDDILFHRPPGGSGTCDAMAAGGSGASPVVRR